MLLKPTEIAERLGVTRFAVYRWTREGLIDYVRTGPGGAIRISDKALAEFVQRRGRGKQND